MELQNKIAVVVGLGKSGVASAKLLKARGASVLALDQRPKEELSPAARELETIGVSVKAGGYARPDFSSAQLVVLSPGVNEKDEMYASLSEQGVEVIGDLELAVRFVQAPIIAVTGTDGKTTTVTLLGEILARQFPGKVWVGGNIGQPVADLVLSDARPEAVVLEVSSFQLAQARTFHPKVAVMLNLAPDHFDRHKDFDDYYQAKLRIFMNQDAGDAAVLNFDDPLVRNMSEKIKSRLIWFGQRIEQNHGAFLAGKELVYRNSRQEFKLSLRQWKLLGKHNLENLLGAAAAAGWFGVGREAVQDALNNFKPPAHRIEFVAEVAGVKYYDDSKATNPHSVAAALQSFSDPLILLLGGRNKQMEFSSLAPLVKARARFVICFGESGDEIKSQLERTGIICQRVDRMKDAVALAAELAEPGMVALLSPGCASFDEFKDYKERGNIFKELVRGLK
jgi:UDP-N-acetylmuramoylalanine--D-glutamate ligase